jgi:hypothetical protein
VHGGSHDCQQTGPRPQFATGNICRPLWADLLLNVVSSQGLAQLRGQEQERNPAATSPLQKVLRQLRLTPTTKQSDRQIVRMRVLGHQSREAAGLASEASSCSRQAAVVPRSPRVHLPGLRKLVVSNVIAPLREEQQVAGASKTSSNEKSRNLLDPAAVGDLLVSTWRALPLGGGQASTEVSKEAFREGGQFCLAYSATSSLQISQSLCACGHDACFL